MTIVVFGSINLDLVTRTPRLPAPGETLIGHAFFTASGGKGANQAVACARLGARTRLIGRVGDDLFGAGLLESLRNYQVEVDAVAIEPNNASGVAVIAVDDRAENTIIVVPGANALLGSAEIERLEQALPAARAVLLQLEIPMDTVVAAARAARARGVHVILDPAPARELPSELYRAIDILTPNEGETAVLVGFAVEDEAAVVRAAALLLQRGPRVVVVKRGNRGVYWADGQTSEFRPPFAVEAVDTVAAGDAFNGGLAVALAEGLPFGTAIDWALATSAIAVTRAGAQQSMPTRDEVLALIVAQRPST